MFLLIFYIFRRRRSISRERAASLALSLKGFENGALKDDNMNAKTITPLLQNSDFLLNRKNSTASNQSEKKNIIIADFEIETAHKIKDSDVPVEERHYLNATEKENSPDKVLDTDKISDSQTSTICNEINNTDKDTNRLSYEQRMED